MTTEPEPTRLRVATLNMFGTRSRWPQRHRVLADGFHTLQPDLVSFQEVIVSGGYDQAQEVLGDGYHIVHHGFREPDGQGITIASRWPVRSVSEIDLRMASPSGFACSALAAEIAVPGPVGDVLFVDHLPDWQLTREYQRELQTVRVAGFIEEWLQNRQAHVVVAGDLDATPDAATIRFWTGKQSLGGLSVCYRDAWAALHPEGGAGHTFTTDNDLVRLGDGGAWAQELGRRIDYILVRCLAHGPTLRVSACERLFDSPVDGIWGSDHFGVVADLEPIG
jgi:endonuclease/exonuclease/phosphatase family metal-dependent hydrolase